jgi:hypothetical protein
MASTPLRTSGVGFDGNAPIFHGQSGEFGAQVKGLERNDKEVSSFLISVSPGLGKVK